MANITVTEVSVEDYERLCDLIGERNRIIRRHAKERSRVGYIKGRQADKLAVRRVQAAERKAIDREIESITRKTLSTTTEK